MLLCNVVNDTFYFRTKNIIFRNFLDFSRKMTNQSLHYETFEKEIIFHRILN